MVPVLKKAARTLSVVTASALRCRRFAAVSYSCGVSSEPLRGLSIGATLDIVAAANPARRAVVVPSQPRFGRGLTYAQLLEKTNAIAAGLLRLGIMPGDKVALWSPNCAEWVVAQMACAKAGLILVSINPASRASELEYALRKVACKALIMASLDASTDYVSILAGVVPEVISAHSPAGLHSVRLPSLKHIVVLDHSATSTPAHSQLPARSHPPGAHTWGDLTRMAGPADLADMQSIAGSVDADDLCAVQVSAALSRVEIACPTHICTPCDLQYTSGTTGSPKAAGLSHHNVLNNALLATASQGLTSDDTILCNVPMFHCFGQVLASLGILSRGGALLMPSPRFDAELSLRAAAAEGATSLYAVPTMVIRLLQSPLFPEVRGSAFELREMERGACCLHASVIRGLVISFGAAATPNLWAPAHRDPGGKHSPRFARAGARYRVGPPWDHNWVRRHGFHAKATHVATYVPYSCFSGGCRYGMTETSPLSFQTTPSDPEWARCETVGRVLPHTEAKIVDPATGRVVPRGTIGELATRGCVDLRCKGQALYRDA